MHCDRCNVDFPDGLRYCKWCGEALADRPRITSELHSCPSCSAAIQPGWTFCKACGERLNSAARPAAEGTCPSCGAETEPDAQKCVRCGNDLTSANARRVAPESADTSLIAMCAACGERLDTGSLYCKACGSSVYTEQTPFGGSALLCGACKSYSPVGSSVCRVCGANFAQGSRTVVDSRAPAKPVQQKAPTLPDLDKHVSEKTPAAKPGQEPIVDSGARTFIFNEADPASDSATPRGGVETNVLSGGAGGKAGQQAPTAVMQMGRITGPVEPDEVQEASQTSGGLTKASSRAAEVKPPENHGQPVAIDQTVEFAASSPSPTGQEPTTLGLGSESESESGGSEDKTAVFISPAQPAKPASQEQIASDDIGTRKFAPAPPPPAPELITEIPRSKAVTSDRVAPTGQMASAPQRTLVETAGPTPTEFSQPESQASARPQVSSQPLPEKRTGMVIATVVVVLLLVGGGGYVGWLLFGRGKPAPPVAPPVAVEQPQVTPGPIPEKPPAPVAPEGMVMVSAGSYAIGRDGADPLEQPEHKVDLTAFFIDRTEVTNAAYKKFVDATGHKAPSNWTGSSFPEGRENFPVTGVTWQDAADYAAWSGKRLPKEVEWEAAARGNDGRIYPWGNGWRSGVANIGQKPDKATPDQYPTGIKEVGRYPEGASPAGVFDMIGNAWEWVEDEIDVYPGNSESKLDLAPGTTYRVIRGGAYDGSKVNDATYRGYLDASQAYPKVGFRCAKDAR